MAGPVARRRAGDAAETLWESGDLVASPTTEEEWDKWQELYNLVEKADGKGISDAAEKAIKSGYTAARSGYRDAIFENTYAPAGWTREQFDEVREMYAGTPAGEAFRSGQLGTDYATLKDGGMNAMSSESLSEYMGKEELDEGKALFEGIETPDLQEFDPKLYEKGADLDLNVAQFDEMDPSKWSGGDTAMDQSLEYMQHIMAGGEDAAANAEWNRRKDEAEQLARGNREATMRAMEVQGMAGSGNELLADLEGQGQLTQSLFNAGLDAAGMEQERRDEAAGQAYTMGGGIADKQDAWHVMTTQRDDANRVYATSIENQEIGENYNRTNTVNDANVPIVNAAEMYNIHDIPLQEFGNNMTLVGAKAGQGVNIANFGGQYDQFNQGLGFEEFKLDQTQPNAWDYIAGGLGTAASLGTAAGNIAGGLNK